MKNIVWNEFCGMGISFTMDGFRMVQTLLACFMWLVSCCFYAGCSREDKYRGRFWLFTGLTLAATLGVFLSADLYTTFIFFEIMSFTSFVWVMHTQTRKAASAARTYLAIAVTGGLVMLMGLFLLYTSTGTLRFGELLQACEQVRDRRILYAAGLCLLFGFGAKAGLFGLHVWMADSYDAAPAPASALLSGVLSKTGVFGIILISSNLFFRDTVWGMLLTVCGLLTMVCGAVLAIFSPQLKRTLAYSSMSQIGFMITGIGMLVLLGSDGALAARGTALHMINHSVAKLVLFLLAGWILEQAGSLEINRIRGFGRKKPLLGVLFVIPALGIGGIPLFSGYVSKTLLHESILEAMQTGLYDAGFLHMAEAVFLISGGCTIAYMTKWFVAIFMEKNEDKQLQAEYDVKRSCPDGLQAGLLAAVCLFIAAAGLLPGQISDRIADWSQSLFYVEDLQEQVHYFSGTNLKGALISLLIGAILYFVVIRYCMVKEDKSYGDYWPKWWDAQRLLYRPVFLIILPAIGGFLSRVCDSALDSIVVLLRKSVLKDEKLPFELEEGTVITYRTGGALDALSALRNRLLHREKEVITPETSYRHRLAVKYEEILENRFIISRSLSFGLLLFCVGLCFTLVYVLVK